METNNRIKQTARKTTGGVSPQEFIQQGNPLMPTLLNHESGKPPPPKKGIFSSSSAQHHVDTQRGPIQNRSEHNLTSPNVQPRSPMQNRKQMSRGDTTKTHSSPPQKKAEDLDQMNSIAMNHIRSDLMWTAPTSNVRGGNEEEVDELLSSPSSISHVEPLVAKTKVNAITKCDRCRSMASNPICEPYPGSKKCAKCVRDHRNCSWTSGPPPSHGGNSPLKMGEAKSMIQEKRKKAPDPEHDAKSKIDPKPTSSGQAQQIGPKCTRCASFAHSPICERSDDPNDAKCKKCRRDKQSCSFAPFGKPFTKRKKNASSDAADEDDVDEENQRQEGKIETAIKEKKKDAENDAEKRTGPDNGRNEKRPSSPQTLSTMAERQQNTSKRKKDASQDDNSSENDKNPTKKRKRPSASRTIMSSSHGTFHVANSSPHRDLQSRSNLPRLHQNGTRNSSTPPPATTPRVISIPPALQVQANGHPHSSRNSTSVGPSTVIRPMGQPAEAVERRQDRSVAVIERELSAAEMKAASHRAIAESYMKDAIRAEEEVARLKDELLTTVRRSTNLGAEGIASERKKLVEKLLAGGDLRM